MLTVVPEVSDTNTNAPAAVGGSMLDELAREGARQMLAAALQAEVAAYIDAHTDQVDENGHRLVVRNGYHRPREVATYSSCLLSEPVSRVWVVSAVTPCAPWMVVA